MESPALEPAAASPAVEPWRLTLVQSPPVSPPSLLAGPRPSRASPWQLATYRRGGGS